MSGPTSRQPLITSVAIKRPLTPGFWALLLTIMLLAIAAAGVAWHSEKKHRQAKHSVRDLSRELTRVENEMQALKAREGLFDGQLKQQQLMLDRLLASGSAVRQRWLADRVSAAAGVAEQTLALSRDVVAARQALLAADQLLASQPEAALLPLRRALQQDIGILGSIAAPDVPGIYLRLQALDRRLALLALPRETGQRGPDSKPAAAPAASAAASVPAADRLATLWAQGLAKFRELIVIREYDQPLQPLLDDARRQLVRDQLALTLDQAELALLRGESVLYRAALESVSLRLQRDFSALPNTALVPVLNELAALQSMQVQIDVPALATRAALDALAVQSGGVL